MDITPHVWKYTENSDKIEYGITLICNKMLIIDGINKKENIVSKLQSTKTQINADNNIDNKNNKFDIPLKSLEVHKYKLSNNYNHNDMIINI